LKRAIFPAVVALAFAAAGCPEEFGLQCPPGTTSLGQFNLLFVAQHPDAGECIATTTDAGVTSSSYLTADDGGSSGIFCYSATASGGTSITLVVPGGGGARNTALVDGGFSFVAAPTASTPGTACVCDVVIAETFSGTFVPFDGGTEAPYPDGGLPFVSAISGTLQDTLTAADAGDTSCACATPCTVTYGIVGSPF
jgi:hypothetical protein